jgi:hypothetical protein
MKEEDKEPLEIEILEHVSKIKVMRNTASNCSTSH